MRTIEMPEGGIKVAVEKTAVAERINRVKELVRDSNPSKSKGPLAMWGETPWGQTPWGQTPWGNSPD